MNRRPGTKIIEEISYESVHVGDNVHVRVVELVWNGGGRSFDVYRVIEDELLTTEESFDAMPTVEQLRELAGASTRLLDDVFTSAQRETLLRTLAEIIGADTADLSDLSARQIELAEQARQIYRTWLDAEADEDAEVSS